MRISDWSSDVCSSDLQGDNRTGEGDGDDEQVKIILSKIPAEIDKVAIAVTIPEGEQRGQSFGQVSNAFIRAVDNKTGPEIVRYVLSEAASPETAMILGAVYRHGAVWTFRDRGHGLTGGARKRGKAGQRRAVRVEK